MIETKYSITTWTPFTLTVWILLIRFTIPFISTATQLPSASFVLLVILQTSLILLQSLQNHLGLNQFLIEHVIYEHIVWVSNLYIHLLFNSFILRLLVNFCIIIGISGVLQVCVCIHFLPQFEHSLIFL